MGLQLEANVSDFRGFSEGRPFLWLAVMAYARCARPRLLLSARKPIRVVASRLRAQRTKRRTRSSFR